MNLPYYVKAIYVGIVTFLGALSSVLLAGGEEFGLSDITTAGWVGIVTTTVIAVGGVLGLQAAPARISTSVKPEKK